MNKHTNLIWLDLEMTGLEPDTDVILQAAVIATDNNLEPLDEGIVCYIHQPKNVLNTMNEWCKETHTANGLIEKCLKSTTSLETAEQLCLSYASKWTEKGVSPLCGNTIGQDRRFLYRYMPKFSEFLHYRSLDVTSLKIIKDICYPQILDFPKKDTHEALLDIQESISELKYYREKLLL
jgi:oligoribonuclease